MTLRSLHPITRVFGETWVRGRSGERGDRWGRRELQRVRLVYSRGGVEEGGGVGGVMGDSPPLTSHYSGVWSDMGARKGWGERRQTGKRRGTRELQRMRLVDGGGGETEGTENDQVAKSEGQKWKGTGPKQG